MQSNYLLEVLSGPWHWAVSGAGIAATAFLLTWMGRAFAISLSFRNFCSLAGAGKINDFFKIDWAQERWRMAFVAGAVAGGFIAVHFLKSPDPVQISQATIDHLSSIGIPYPESDEKGLGFINTALFNFSNGKGLLIVIIGSFCIGFGARYANGCTSGHAITGLSHLQLPSLLTVIGFFAGGLIMTHFIMPLIFG